MKEIARQVESRVKFCLERWPAVVLAGSRQIGKTTSARRICKQHEAGCAYFDLDHVDVRDNMDKPESVFAEHPGKLIVIDEISRKQELFSFLRYYIDKQKHEGGARNKFLLLGSASERLFRQQRTTLTGRMIKVNMTVLNCLEVPSQQMHKLWDVGGYPESFLAANRAESMDWRSASMDSVVDDLRLYLTGGLKIDTVKRLLVYLARTQGSTMNRSNIARELNVSSNTIGNYLEHLEYLFLIRELPCYVWGNKAGKRLTRASKYFVRDSGLVHALTDARVSADGKFNPQRLKGASWEGFVIENLTSVFAPRWSPHFYRTHNGAEVDLVIEFPGSRLWTVEIKAGKSPSASRSHTQALKDLQPERSFIVHHGNDLWNTKNKTFITTLPEMMKILIAERDAEKNSDLA